MSSSSRGTRHWSKYSAVNRGNSSSRNSPYTGAYSSVHSPFTGMVDQGGGGGGGGTPLKSPTENLMTMKPPSQQSGLAECFKLSCGDKSRSNVPKRLTAPPSESLFKYGVRALWADKHSPKSLSAFQCHTQQAQQLKQLISYGNCPHLLLQGPSGAGKRALAIALLHDIYGDVKVLPEHRPFAVQGGPYPTITVPIATSKHHVEVNLLHIGEYDKDVLPTIFKEIHMSSERARLSPITSQAESEFKLILVENGEKLTQEAQQILRKLMDRYGDTCKLVLCCNMKDETFKDAVLREGIRSRSQIINVEVPSEEEIVKVLTTVAKKESISLPKAFATRIAIHCKDSLRKAIVQLEACKNYQYPFLLDQPVHMSHWEENIVRIVADIVADPTPRRLFAVRVKLQALLTDCVSAILILQKLLEEFLHLTDVQLKKQICHWAGFYETRLRTVPNPIVQLEAFLAKVMIMYKAQSISTARLSYTASRYSSDSSDVHEMEKSPLVRPLVTSPYFSMKRT